VASGQPDMSDGVAGVVQGIDDVPRSQRDAHSGRE
jgi:hypothetical protein